MKIFIEQVNKKIKQMLLEGPDSLEGLFFESNLSVGKRLRAETFFAFAEERNDLNLDLASAVEILHAATLIHDDVVDNASLRRGKEALYLTKGVSKSVLYGDYLFSRAFALISSKGDPEITTEVMSSLSKVLKGEILEQYSKEKLFMDESRYFEIIRMKSGELFGVSARMGAMVRPGKDIDPDEAYMYGSDLGAIYQMIDDYLDYFGERKDKDKFRDIKEKIVTLPLIKLINKCSSDEVNKIKAVMGAKSLREDDLNVLICLMRDHNIGSEVLGEINARYAEAQRIYRKFAGGTLPRGTDILSFVNKRPIYV